jgi:hypothetical protein
VQVLEAWPFDARALAERGLLLLDMGRLQDGRRALGEALERQPGQPALVAALARAERETAAEEKRVLSEESLAEVLAAPGRLRGLDRAFEPLARLQQGRGILALSDGQVRLEAAGRELNALHRWVRPRLELEADRFEGWWSRRIHEAVFASIEPDSEIQTEQVPVIAGQLQDNAARIDLLEEDYWLRWTSSALPPAA